jgi:hypothetical protein
MKADTSRRRWSTRVIRAAALMIGIACGMGPVGARSKPALARCQTFMRDFAAALGDLKVDFGRALVVGGRPRRGDVYNLVSEQEVDGTLECVGDEIVRLELRIAVPANARTQRHFERFQPAALRAAMKWDNARIASLLARMTADVTEFLRASEQRGDVYVSGHDERHLPDGTTLGLFWTETDRALVISTASD